MSIITCNNVTKRYGNFTALNNVSLEIPEGKIFGLLGPNGAGKTTLIRMLTQITRPDEGEILFKGEALRETDVERIGYLPEERGLYKKMKVGEQALYLAQLKGIDKTEAVDRLKEWFVKFGIQAWWNKKVEELSKGMAQKVQFITTVLHKPQLVILDEPFSGFDPVNVSLIRDEILKMRDNGATIILSTHNMESVEELCDNIALINKANLVITGNTAEIRRQYGKNEVEVRYRGQEMSSSRYYDVIEDNAGQYEHRAILARKDNAPNAAILTALMDAGCDIVSYQELIPRMNDIFIKLVTQ